MKNRTRLVYFVSSAIIGIIVVIVVVSTLILTGVLDVSSNKLVFSSASKEVVYDGQVLTCDEWKFVDGKLDEGHTAKVSVIGAQASAGKSENTFVVSIIDEAGNDVTKEYEIEKITGELSVLALPLTVTTNGYSKVYDGVALSGVESDCAITSVTQPLEGHTYEFSVSGTQLDVGTSSNVAEICIYDAEGNVVTSNYAITYNYG